ncbi:hypothetical protein TBCH5v1_2020 [Thermococcus barophilus]|uniref:Uncharacterized protein n=1 Tax=Thermococcus barophilus TaxID=55802 RepID=A0A0S1XDU4_THEBA|nr:hypothetical protein TBCH5v1_2020 [Thermococcus barophilus]
MLRTVNSVSKEVSRAALNVRGVKEKFMTKDRVMTKKKTAKNSLSRDLTTSLKVGDAKTRPYIRKPSSLDCLGAK